MKGKLCFAHKAYNANKFKKHQIIFYMKATSICPLKVFRVG